MKKIWEACKNFVLVKPYSTSFCFAVFTTALIYCLHMRSVIGGIRSLCASPLHAILNFLILLLLYSLPLFFRRRLAGTFLVFAFCLGFGIGDCVLMGIRPNRPLMASDFAIFEFSIVGQYLNLFQILLVVFAIAGGIAGIVFLFIKLPKTHAARLLTLKYVGGTALSFVILFAGLAAVDAVDPAKMKNRKNAYEAYGFPYCFLWSCFDKGIERPEDYSDKAVNELLLELSGEESSAPSRTPNIVFVQLESLFDITRYTDLTLSADPLPNLRALREESVYGLLTVPSIGAGTANTEFEVLTGLPIEFFGAGEYPYETILSRTACESIAYNLSAFGYKTHAIHNHTATFYDRHLVYANLGFDRYTGAEFMPELERNLIGWAKDAVLTDIILDSLDSTAESDLVFTVSVQAHGRYPQMPLEGEVRNISVTGDLDPDLLNSFEYYVNQLYEVDAFVGELIAALREYDEEVVLVLYGDHLPSLEIDESALAEGSLFSSDYWLWSNRGMETAGTRLDLRAHELSAVVLGNLGIEKGLISRIYRAYRGNEKLLMQALKLVGYDMLYGDQLAYGGKEPYVKSDMKLGLYDIKIHALERVDEDDYVLRGENFTAASFVFLNGKQIESTYVSSTELYLPSRKLKEGDSLTVVQISSDVQKLAETKPFILG